ncbi:MAG: DJ-1/PfpI family protein [Deltaproteobacteria bacterium]|nr:DJ-1/PfpI family protein [Deltaproteobacteria bacterium]
MHRLVEFVIFPDALGLDLTGPLEVFHTATAFLAHEGQADLGYTCRFVSLAPSPVRLSSGLAVVAEPPPPLPPVPDLLVSPGGPGARAAEQDPELVAFFRARARQARRVVSVCNGAFILAAAGLLDGRQATTHWRSSEELAARYPRVRLTPDAIYTRDGRIYTSAGVTAGIDLALAIVEEDFGLSLAVEVARLLVLYLRRPGGQSQFSAPLAAQAAAGRRFAGLHAWLLAHLDQPTSVAQMAERAAMSPRNFARVFKSETGLTPNKYLETLRLDRAREIIAAGGDSLENIAQACGFGREEQLRRSFLRRFAVTPSQYRLHFLQPPAGSM